MYSLLIERDLGTCVRWLFIACHANTCPIRLTCAHDLHAQTVKRVRDMTSCVLLRRCLPWMRLTSPWRRPQSWGRVPLCPGQWRRRSRCGCRWETCTSCSRWGWKRRRTTRAIRPPSLDAGCSWWLRMAPPGPDLPPAPREQVPQEDPGLSGNGAPSSMQCEADWSTWHSSPVVDRIVISSKIRPKFQFQFRNRISLLLDTRSQLLVQSGSHLCSLCKQTTAGPY